MFQSGRLSTYKIYAGVAELADALDLGSSAFGVGVRLPSPAPKIRGCNSMVEC
jgi:hypothetical protein